MKIFHENPIFWNSEIESGNFTVWNSERLSVSNSPRNLYNSLKSIKEKSCFPSKMIQFINYLETLEKRSTDNIGVCLQCERIVGHAVANQHEQGSKLTVASSKFATWKSYLPPVEKVGSKKLLPGKSIAKLLSGKKKQIFTKELLKFCLTACKAKHNSIWSKALLMLLTICNSVWS